MSAVRGWLLRVAAAALAVAMAQALTPEGTIKKVVRFAGGLVLLLAVLSPGLTIDRESLATLLSQEELGAQDAAQKGEETLKTLIAQRTGAYIVDKGRSIGCTVSRVAVTAADSGSGWPVPWSVQVTGSWTQEQRLTLGEAIKEELGIPPDRQSFLEEEP